MPFKPYVSLKTNIPELVEFQFNEPLKDKVTGSIWKQNQWGKNQCIFGVVHNGIDSYLTCSEALYNIVNQVENLQGKTLEILKYEDGTTKLWKVLYNGEEVGKGTNVPNQPENPVQVNLEAKNDHSSCEMTFAKMRIAFRELEKRIEAAETILEGMTTNAARDLHQSTAGKSKTVEMAAEALAGTVEDDGFPRK